MVKEIGRQLKALETSSWLRFSGETGRQQWFSKIYYEGLTAVKDAKGSSHLFCGTVFPFENYYFTPKKWLFFKIVRFVFQISQSPKKIIPKILSLKFE